MHSRKSLAWPSHGMDCSTGTRCLNFLTFIHQMSKIDDTWKFWAQFVFSDCYCYVVLYLAIRVAIGSCVYQAWSRWHHSLQPLIGTHIWKNNSSTSCWSSAIPIRNFKVPWNRWVYCEHKRAKVALSSIWWSTYKDLKMAVVHPTKTYLQKTTLFFTQSTNSNTILDSTSQANHREENMQQMCSTISTCRLLPPQLQTNRELFNAFNGQQATPEQSSDMLTFCQIGIQAFKHCM